MWQDGERYFFLGIWAGLVLLYPNRRSGLDMGEELLLLYPIWGWSLDMGEDLFLSYPIFC